METIICNDFSLHMLIEDSTIQIKKISLEKFNEILNTVEYVSCIGDKDIANALGLAFNKSNIVLNENNKLIVAKLSGGRTITDISKNFDFYEINYVC